MDFFTTRGVAVLSVGGVAMAGFAAHAPPQGEDMTGDGMTKAGKQHEPGVTQLAHFKSVQRA